MNLATWLAEGTLVGCSNVAAPVLCFSLVEPILRTLDAKHSYAKSLVMGELVDLI